MYLEQNPKIMKEVEEKIRENFSQAFEKSLADTEENTDNEEIQEDE